MKNISLILICGITCLLGVVACGLSEDSKSKVEDLREEYTDAIENRNFDKARTLAEKADRLVERGSNLKYVNEKEIYYLLADNSRNNSDRIFYMFNAFDLSQLPDMTDVLKVAASRGNEYLGIQLIKGGVKPDDNVINAAVINELNDLLLLIAQKDISTLNNETFMTYACGQEALKEYAEKYHAVIEERNLKEFDIDLNKLLSYSIFSRPATGLVKSNLYGEIPKEYINYNKEAEIYNEKANELLVRAIGLNKENQAQKIIAYMKPTLEWKVLGDWAHVVEHTPKNSSVFNAFQVSESREDIEKAKGLLKIK